mgnify:CR=1 FL=1
MPSNSTTGARPLRLAATALALALTAGLAGCGSAAKLTDKLSTGAISRGSSRPVETMSSAELRRESIALGRAYARNPTDKGLAIRFATVLQMDGDADQSLAVMRKLAIGYPKDREVLAAYGKALAANGQLEPALDAVRRAQTPEYPDWRLVSAEGAILDQLGQNDEARQLYRKALTAAYARTWRWWWACKAASTRPSRSPRRNFRPTRRWPTSPICGACSRSRTPGTS